MVDSFHAGVHRRLVFNRRRDRLVRAIESALPLECSVLDIGCGNGEIGAALTARGRQVVGVETLARPSCEVPMVLYDGVDLPFDDGTFDWAVTIDVLHHASDPSAVLAEARRVTRRGIIVKDHYAETPLQRFRLGVMDWVGNRQFGVGREGEYLSRAKWRALWESLQLDVTHLCEDLDLYPAPADLVFERGLHFVARLEPSA